MNCRHLLSWKDIVPHGPRTNMKGTHFMRYCWGWLDYGSLGLDRTFHGGFQIISLLRALFMGFLQTLKYTLRQNYLALQRTAPRAGKVNPDQYQWTSALGLISATLHMGKFGSWFSCTSSHKWHCTEAITVHKNNRACLSFVAGNGLDIAPYRLHSSQGHAEEPTQLGTLVGALTSWQQSQGDSAQEIISFLCKSL